MPRQSDLEDFKRDLAVLSREDAVLAAWGESREEPPAPGDLSGPSPGAPAPDSGADEPSSFGADDDIAALLGDGLSELASEEEAPAGLGTDEETGHDADSFSMPDFGGEVGGATDGAPGPEASVPVEETGFPDFDLAAFAEPPAGSDFELAAEAPAIEEVAESPADMDAFAEDLDALAEVPTEALPEAPAVVDNDEPSSLGDFSMPDFGVETPLEAPSESPSELEAFTEAPAEAFAEDLEAFTEAPTEAPSSAETGEPSSLDDFSIPDFEATESGAAAPAPKKAANAMDTGIGSLGDLGSFELGADTFDSFSFEEGGGTAAPSSEALDRELASLGEGTPDEASFSLDAGWSGDFEEPVGGTAAGAAAVTPPGGARPPGAPRGTGAAPPPRATPRPHGEREEKVRAVVLTEAQVDRLQDVLLALPLNVRVAVEKIVAEELGTEAQRCRLVWMLVEVAKAEEIASLAGRVLKKRITVPPGFEKSTGAAFEAEKGSFRYILLRTVLPIVRTALLALVIAGTLGWMGWRFVYRPLVADSLYRHGYALIAQERHADAEDSFRRAGEIRQYKSWYYRYAEAYADRAQDIRAEGKYKSLLDAWPGELKAALDWARLERRQAKYETAIEVLETRVLQRKATYLQKDALLLKADVYLDWAEDERGQKRSELLEEARRSAAALIQAHGSQDPYEERMLLYFIRSGNVKEALPLAERFMAMEKPSPSAATLAELGGFFFDQEQYDRVRRVLVAAVGKDPGVPESHYHLARNFNRVSDREEERKSLENAVAAFRALPTLSRRQLSQFIDTLVRRGRLRSAAGEWVGAEEDYAAAVAVYEDGLSLGRLDRLPTYAAAYAGLAEVAYLQRDDMMDSLALYEKAAEDGFDNERLRYRRGYALYRLGRYGEALEQLYRAGAAGKESPYLLFAFGNSLYQRKDWFAAEGYFRRAVEYMKAELDRVGTPNPQVVASEGEIVRLLMEATNNLAAALYRTGTRLGDPRRRTSAMERFAESARLSDSLTRDQASMVRPESQNLGFLNMDKVLRPARGYDIAIYTDIERDMDYPRR